MAQIQYIKDLYENEEKSLREISRITGHSFETVQKYAQKDNWSEDNLPDTEPTSYPVLGDFIPIVDGWLEADRKIPRKQRHTAWRLFCRLRDEYGFTGSYSSVKRYVRKKKYVMKVPNAGFLPLQRIPGCGQVDFREFLYYDSAGQEQKGYALTISFPHSNKGYTQAFPSQNQECLLEGMRRIFEHIGGVPPRLRFDNMTTAVAQVLRGHKRTLTDGFGRFMLHYRFQAEFCNPASGNEKGNVENKVGYSRRNAFVPVPTITSFEKFNEDYLWDWCETDAQRDHYIHKIPIQALWRADADDADTKLFHYFSLHTAACGCLAVSIIIDKRCAVFHFLAKCRTFLFPETTDELSCGGSVFGGQCRAFPFFLGILIEIHTPPYPVCYRLLKLYWIQIVFCFGLRYNRGTDKGKRRSFS